MKKRMLGVAAIAALALLPGCGKKEAQPVPGPTKPQDSVQQTPAAEPQKQLKAVQADAVQAVEKTAAAAAAVPTPAAERAEAAVPAVAAKVEAEAKTATSAFDKLVAEAQALITNRKYTDALAKLQAGLQQPDLDAAQKSTLQKLIDMAKAALTSEATKGVQNKAGGLLKGIGGK